MYTHEVEQTTNDLTDIFLGRQKYRVGGTKEVVERKVRLQMQFPFMPFHSQQDVAHLCCV